MAIYRGDGGSGDATNDVTVNRVAELTSEAEASATSASSSATSASTSASAASTSATNAANSATAASTSETNAASSATSAASSATNAASSETNAAASETAAAASETAAGLSETAAAASETNAATSATNAATSATNASTSATSASSSASSASTSATNASTSETNAASSASAAATSATNAASSATSASNDAATATTKASEASTSASNAATSETNAAASESAAATSATNASTSETNAAASETAAASSASAASTSATNAATSASGAATSASSAATSASNASASADAALSALDNFDDRYLGQKTSDPTTDNDGDALVAGALYFNTTSDVMKVYEGSTWVAAYASLAGALLVSNNLSDLNSASTALTNLGISNHDDITVDGSGNVGIGTNSPLTKLHVQDSTTAGTIHLGQDYYGQIKNNGNNLELIANGDQAFRVNAGTNNGTGNIVFKTAGLTTGNTERMRIDSSGNVGIGTASPSRLLTLASSDPRIRLEDTDQSVKVELINSGGDGILTTNGSSNIKFQTNNTERMRIDFSGNLKFDSGYGSVATAYGCRAWVNFNGTGTVAIREDGNVSSITDNGTGDYTVNFTNAMPDSNFAPNITSGNDSSTLLNARIPYFTTTPFSSTAFRFRIRAENGTLANDPDIAVSVFR